MNLKRRKKLTFFLSLVLLLGAATGLMLYALKQNINLFYTPTQLLTGDLKADQTFRLGGYVKKHSVVYDVSGEAVSFVVTDRKNELLIHFRGVLPNLFKEGQTVVVTGKLSDPHTFTASEVLAKHDEKYMPKGLAEQLNQGDNHGA